MRPRNLALPPYRVRSARFLKTPHPVPLPIRWGEGGRRPGEGNKCVTSAWWWCRVAPGIGGAAIKSVGQPRSAATNSRRISFFGDRRVVFIRGYDEPSRRRNNSRHRHHWFAQKYTTNQ